HVIPDDAATTELASPSLHAALPILLPAGTFLRTSEAPRAATGPDLRHLLLGSEGTLGVIAGVDLSLLRLPEARVSAAYYVPDMRAGFEVQREIRSEERRVGKEGRPRW